MRPDTFTELIRRKLESIRPDVTERDWTRMQSSLQQAGLSGSPVAPVVGPGSVPSWLLGVVGIGMAALLATAIWQRSEISTLRHTLARTTDQRSQSAVTNAPDRSISLLPARSDTVYITRYIRVPIMSKNGSVAQNRNNLDAYQSENLPTRTGTPIDSLVFVPQDRISQWPGGQSENTLVQQTLSLPNGVVSPKKQRQSQLPTESAQSANNDLASRTAGRRESSRQEIITAQSATSGQGQATAALELEAETVDHMPGADQRTDFLSKKLSLLATPSILTDVDWHTRLMRKFRRAQLEPVVLDQAQPAESQSVSRLAVRTRVGAGTDIQARGWNAGAVAELLLDSHWTLSAGLVRSSQLLGSYLTDDDYDFQTRHSFRREFAPTSDPRRDIYGISILNIRYQIPVTLGYRIRLGRSLSFVPSLGTYVDMSNTVQVSFSYRKPLRQGFDHVDLQNDRPHNLLNTYTAGAGLEWQKTHWIVQGGLLYTRPFSSDMNVTAAPALGGRLRLLYQF